MNNLKERNIGRKKRERKFFDFSFFRWMLGKMRGGVTEAYPFLVNAESPVEKSRKITKFFDILCSPTGSHQEYVPRERESS